MDIHITNKTMAKKFTKVVFGRTYYLKNGDEFIPVAMETGKETGNIWMPGERSPRVYIDANGRRVKKGNFKQETPNR